MMKFHFSHFKLKKQLFYKKFDSKMLNFKILRSSSPCLFRCPGICVGEKLNEDADRRTKACKSILIKIHFFSHLITILLPCSCTPSYRTARPDILTLPKLCDIFGCLPYFVVTRRSYVMLKNYFTLKQASEPIKYLKQAKSTNIAIEHVHLSSHYLPAAIPCLGFSSTDWSLFASRLCVSSEY